MFGNANVYIHVNIVRMWREQCGSEASMLAASLPGLRARTWAVKAPCSR